MHFLEFIQYVASNDILYEPLTFNHDHKSFDFAQNHLDFCAP